MFKLHAVCRLLMKNSVHRQLDSHGSFDSRCFLRHERFYQGCTKEFRGDDFQAYYKGSRSDVLDKTHSSRLSNCFIQTSRKLRAFSDQESLLLKIFTAKTQIEESSM